MAVTGNAATTSVQTERVITRTNVQVRSLPAVATGGSQAYGAVGKTGLAPELNAPSNSTTFTEAFTSRRRANTGTAQTAQNPTRPAPLAQPATGYSARPQVPVVTAVAEEESESEDSLLPTPSPHIRRRRPMATGGGGPVVYDRPPSISYGTVHEGGAMEGRWPGDFRRDVNARYASSRSGDVVRWLFEAEMAPAPTPRPSAYETLRRWTALSWIASALWWFVVVGFLVSLLYIFIYGRLPPPDQAVFRRAFSLNPEARARRTAYVEAGYRIPRDFAENGQERLLKLHHAVQMLWDSNELTVESVKKLEDELPHLLVVKKNNETGQFEIPDQFWKAFSDRLDQLKDSAGKDESSAAHWQNYLARNRKLVGDLTSDVFKKKAKPIVKEALEQLHVVSMDEFITTINRNSKEIAEEIVKLREQMEAKFSREEISRLASDVAIQAVTDQMQQLPMGQLDVIAHANLIKNMETSLKTVNHWSARLGARVDPHLTSPTQAKSLNWKQKIYSSVVWLPSPHPPIAALETWDEATDCWCAAESSDKGKAQLAVLMPYPIYPTKVTVEHIPMGGTLDISSAPKTMELWAQVMDAEKREEVNALREATGIVGGGCSEQSMGPNYVCLGRWKYNIHGLNHVQTFALDVNLRQAGVTTQKAVVRVTQNWGREWTCLYRIRMHGDLEKPLFEKEEAGAETEA